MLYEASHHSHGVMCSSATSGDINLAHVSYLFEHGVGHTDQSVQYISKYLNHLWKLLVHGIKLLQWSCNHKWIVLTGNDSWNVTENFNVRKVDCRATAIQRVKNVERETVQLGRADEVERKTTMCWISMTTKKSNHGYVSHLGVHCKDSSIYIFNQSVWMKMMYNCKSLTSLVWHR